MNEAIEVLVQKARAVVGLWDSLDAVPDTEDGGVPTSVYKDAMDKAVNELREAIEVANAEASS
jgi:hypothetical protein